MSATTTAAEAPLRPSMVASVASTAAAGTAATAALLLAPLVTELDRMAPRVDMHGSQVRVIETPAEFYETLKAMILGAKRRIFLSTLYIGTSERDLVATLQRALRANPDLTLHILTDALRGTRESPRPSSASLLAPLVAEFGPERVDIRMYHTPNLTGLRKKYIPRRINEGWGLQHMKLYGVDDSILLSGANLSNDYFTNRQDRYHVFSSAELTDAYWQLQRGLASVSFRIEPTQAKEEGFNMVWPASNAAPSPLEAPTAFVTQATRVLKKLLEPTTENATSPLLTYGVEAGEKETREAPDTSVYVLAQMTQLLKPDSSTEQPALTHILKTLAAPQYATASSWTFTAGYFNPAPSLTKLLLAMSAQANNTVITAAPQANGFYGSAGVSSLLPDAYTFLAHRFLRAVQAQHHGDAVTLKEWRRGTVGMPGGWTYHAKGLWVTLNPSQAGGRGPLATLSVIGSSNYTKRSYSLDLEANALIVTRNAALQHRLADEQAWLQTHASAVTRDDFAKPERRVRLHVRLAMWIVQLVGGQL
ncbi:CDP-diacylglycerol--glycerol-3-phosphate 3-phosphatidyltransferase [Sporothrix brasiliensis 5110]|uniref:CDP-diacylglycerol--glycerol-3-phosphate 3-phosphatidyltransferase n=1 Tax=Sporothrix brasiliensis 5110 TaxID=1398154 RepID=A0A0C2EP29_9PEZI|nr:CDP-diacylglycerol--glycerol-3-phosphate 3-phosphatidyltransferase [Sporothrix brasiliensis 5110]KIH87934.1 CDP-diacylglycerol--glycerol-3-phosphate 3-phosphatidyltransferase [Sporothrix brasiliensis 5110]